jgi:hypothetical protein
LDKLEKDNNLNQNFAQVFNCFTEPRSDGEQQYKLTSNELFLYAYLSIRKTRIGDIPSCQSHIELVGKNLKFMSKESANKKVIRKTLQSLIDKGVIKCEMDGDSFEAFFSKNNVLDQSGFEPIYGDLFDLAETAEQFTVLCVVKRWQSVSGVCSTAEYRWMEILECGKSTVSRLMKQMKTSGKLFIISGKGKRTYNHYLIGNGIVVSDVQSVEEVLTSTEGTEPQEPLQDKQNSTINALNNETEVYHCHTVEGKYEPDINIFEEIDRDNSLSKSKLLNSNTDTIIDGVQFARFLAENQPLDARKVDYNEQFTDEFKAIPRDILTDPRIYAEYFRINPNEDIYQQVRFLEISVKYQGFWLNLAKEEQFIS